VALGRPTSCTTGWNSNLFRALVMQHRMSSSRAHARPSRVNRTAPHRGSILELRVRDKERDMAEDSNSGASGGLFFIVGGLVVAVGVLVFIFMGGHIPSQPAKVDVKIEAPKQ